MRLAITNQPSHIQFTGAEDEGLTTRTISNSYMNLRSTLVRLGTSAVLLAALNPALSQPWTPASAPVGAWLAVASSSDGTKLAAVRPASYSSSTGFSGGGVYTSTNSGATWTSNNIPCQPWVSLACSTNGSLLYAAAGGSDYGAPIFCSTDWGTTWVQTGAPSNALQSAYWQSIACSADGTRIVAATSQQVFTSVDSGTNWTGRAYLSRYSCVASSADGTQLVAAAGGANSGPITISHDSGVTWAQTSAPSNLNWKSVASSADGTRLAAAAGGAIYTSADSGATWTKVNAPNLLWTSIASSAGGTNLLAASRSQVPIYPGLIYRSSDSGSTWIPTGSPDAFWTGIAASADWKQWVAVAKIGTPINPFGAPIYLWRMAPVLSIEPSTNGVLICWLSGSSASNCVLQQIADLATTNWATVSNEATVVNGQAQVHLSISAPNCFYRVIVP